MQISYFFEAERYMNGNERSFLNPFPASFSIETTRHPCYICKIIWQIALHCYFGGPSLGCWAKRGFVVFGPYINGRSKLKHKPKSSQKSTIFPLTSVPPLFMVYPWVLWGIGRSFTYNTSRRRFFDVVVAEKIQFFISIFRFCVLIYGGRAGSTGVQDRPGLS